MIVHITRLTPVESALRQKALRSTESIGYLPETGLYKKIKSATASFFADLKLIPPKELIGELIAAGAMN